ncbi:MAG: hypothetical protein IT290_05715, partial [Deltaproteobacteria bacterium]|nr:hypothetical protein [Deltaproteobacteria bacterium]
MFARLTFTRKLIRFGNTLLWGAVCATLGFYGGATFMTNSTDEEFKSLASQVKTLRAWEAKVARGEEKLRSALTQLVSNAPAHPPMYTRAGTPKQTGIGGGRERHSKMYRSGKLDMSLVEAVLSGTRVNGGQLYSGGDLSGLSLLLRSLPLGYPVDGPISSVFGHRISPISGSPQLHTGLDFSVVSSTPV